MVRLRLRVVVMDTDVLQLLLVVHPNAAMLLLTDEPSVSALFSEMSSLYFTCDTNPSAFACSTPIYNRVSCIDQVHVATYTNVSTIHIGTEHNIKISLYITGTI